jgi:thiol-disulfide isomerase/thioredoxin
MRKLFLLLLATLFSASAMAQSGRRVVTPPPKPAEPSIQEPAEEPEERPEPPGELLVLPQSLLNRNLRSLESGNFRLADYDDKVIVVNLWASWCGPCRMEVPEYERVRKDFAGRGVEFIALTTEDPNTSSDRVKRFVRDFNFGFRMGWADRDTAVTLMGGRNVIPQTFVIAPGGRIISHWWGFSRGRSGYRLRQAIEGALSQSNGSAQTRQ